MNVRREDVVAAYQLILGRPPESEDVIRRHVAANKHTNTLVKNILSSAEALRRLGLSQGEHEHHVFRGYSIIDPSVIEAFHRYEGTGSPGFVTSFLGCKYRTAFSTSLASYEGSVEGYPLPVGSFQGETAEFVGALRSVLEARDNRFRMLECGAGYGTWMAITWAAALQKKIEDVHVYGIEGDAGHYDFLQQHMADNCIPSTAFTSFHGAIGSKAGYMNWPIVDKPSDDYGSRPLDGGSKDYHGLSPKTIRIKVFALPEILAKEAVWDLLHMDIQGGEGDLCQDCITALSRSVRRVVIGTHSRALDGMLMATFHAAGWSLENEKPTIFQWTENAATLEHLTVVDGVQVWRNPRL